MKSDYQKLANFTRGLGAARLLQKHAHMGGFLIEGLVLYATLVDGLCRIAIALQQQIDSQSSKFDARLIHQEEKEGHYSERRIYGMALRARILDDDLFKEMEVLYEFRNKAIHRFLITDIEYAHIGIVLDRYELIFQRLWTIVYSLEGKQIAAGVGMTKSKRITDGDKKQIEAESFKKINSDNPETLKKILGPAIIADMESFSENAERERIQNEINEEMDVQEEKQKIPPGMTSVKEVTTWARRNKLFVQCSCGHEKVFHLHTTRKTRNLEELLGPCKARACDCGAFEVSK